MDLQGRLTNPLYNFGRAVERLPRILQRPMHSGGAPEKAQKQRRLTQPEVDDLVRIYATGPNARRLAATFGINRETVLLHLQHRGVLSHACTRKLNDGLLADAARRYIAGDSVRSICAKFSINASTLRRELSKAGVQLRQPGRPAAQSG